MSRDTNIALLLGREADDLRRLSLDAADDAARRSNTWGSQEHRNLREGIEKRYDNVRQAFERLSDGELEKLVGQPA